MNFYFYRFAHRAIVLVIALGRVIYEIGNRMFCFGINARARLRRAWPDHENRLRAKLKLGRGFFVKRLF